MEKQAKIADELEKVRDMARAQGWDGEDRDYEYTEADMDAVIDAIGYKPTREEWKEVGLSYVGGKHCHE